MVTPDLPVTCALSNPQLRLREATLVREFKSGTLEVIEVSDGYSFRFDGDKKWLAIAAGLMAAERECCPFLRFRLTAEPGMGSIVVNVSGAAGTKEFLRSIFF